jgi:hypothetical protein
MKSNARNGAQELNQIQMQANGTQENKKLFSAMEPDNNQMNIVLGGGSFDNRSKI